MKNNLLIRYNLRQFKLRLALLVGGIFFIIFSFVLQYHEKKQFLDQQAGYVARAVRNDLITGNQIYIYEQCRSLISDMTIEKLTITRSNKIYCNERKSTTSFFTITTSVPVFFSPSQKHQNENIAGNISLSVVADSMIYGFISSLTLFLLFILVYYRTQKKVHLEVLNEVIEPINLLAHTMTTDRNNLSKIKKAGEGIEVEDIQILYNSYINLIVEIENAEEKIRERSRVTAIVDVSRQVAHDIRSPLETLQITINELEDTPVNVKEIINIALSRINNIANDLLDGKSDFKNVSSENIIELLKTIVAQVKVKNISNKKLSIKLDYSESDELFSFVNPSEFFRAISNLLNNAIEATKFSGNVELSVIKNENNEILIVISDDGIGIPNEILGKLGEQGFSFGKQKYDKSGNGLGLYHAKKTVESFGGHLSIESKLGVGTKVILSLIPSEISIFKSSSLVSDNSNDSFIYDYVYIEDDELLRIAWTSKALKKGIKLLVLESAKNLEQHFVNFSKPNTKFYIDSNLGDNFEKGEVVAELLHSLGYLHLYISSGYESEKFENYPWLKITNKKCPF